MSFRIERINETIKEELSRLIEYELNDPRLKETVIGITQVRTTPDMKYCKVYVSIYADKDKQRELMAVLERAKGFLRKSIAAVLTTRYTPELVFELDDSADYAMHIDKLLREIKHEQ
ncbi:MAG: 30S ribosome-binding factor RbfA [Anaerofustis sp.]